MTTQPDRGGHFGPIRRALCARGPHGAHRGARASLRGRARRSRLSVRAGRTLRTYAGRPTPLYFAKRLSETLGGARLWLKREDLLHTGAHKINIVWARHCGRGAWANAASSPRPARAQHGVATATVARCWASNAWCTWARRICAASASTSSACGCSARRWWACRAAAARSRTPSAKHARLGLEHRRHLLSAGLGAGRASLPHDGARFPEDHREEARRQIWNRGGCRTPSSPAWAAARNAIGIFHAFLPDDSVELTGIESRRRGDAWATTRRVFAASARRPARRLQLRVAGRRRPDRAHPLRFPPAWITP